MDCRVKPGNDESKKLAASGGELPEAAPYRGIGRASST
jgi:hypothetical protein